MAVPTRDSMCGSIKSKVSLSPFGKKRMVKSYAMTLSLCYLVKYKGEFISISHCSHSDRGELVVSEVENKYMCTSMLNICSRGMFPSHI